MRITLECRAIESHPNLGITVLKFELADATGQDAVAATVQISVPLDHPIAQQFDDEATDHQHVLYACTIGVAPVKGA